MIEVKLQPIKMDCYNFGIFYVISYRKRNIEYHTHTHTRSENKGRHNKIKKDNKVLMHKKKQDQNSSVSLPPSSIT